MTDFSDKLIGAGIILAVVGAVDAIEDGFKDVSDRIEELATRTEYRREMLLEKKFRTGSMNLMEERFLLRLMGSQ